MDDEWITICPYCAAVAHYGENAVCEHHIHTTNDEEDGEGATYQDSSAARWGRLSDATTRS